MHSSVSMHTVNSPMHVHTNFPAFGRCVKRQLKARSPEVVRPAQSNACNVKKTLRHSRSTLRRAAQLEATCARTGETPVCLERLSFRIFSAPAPSRGTVEEESWARSMHPHPPGIPAAGHSMKARSAAARCPSWPSRRDLGLRCDV